MIREVSPVGIGGKEWPSEEVMDAESIVMMTKMGWQVNDKVNWDKNGEAEWISESGSWFQRHGDACLNELPAIFNDKMVVKRVSVWKQKRQSVLLRQIGLNRKLLPNPQSYFLSLRHA